MLQLFKRGNQNLKISASVSGAGIKKGVFYTFENTASVTQNLE